MHDVFGCSARRLTGALPALTTAIKLKNETRRPFGKTGAISPAVPESL